MTKGKWWIVFAFVVCASAVFRIAWVNVPNDPPRNISITVPVLVEVPANVSPTAPVKPKTLAERCALDQSILEDIRKDMGPNATPRQIILAQQEFRAMARTSIAEGCTPSQLALSPGEVKDLTAPSPQ